MQSNINGDEVCAGLAVVSAAGLNPPNCKCDRSTMLCKLINYSLAAKEVCWSVHSGFVVVL